MKNIEVKSVIQYFEKKLRQADAAKFEGFAGFGPKYPMAVIYLGEKSLELHNSISDRLTRLWPPYKDELCFLGVIANGYGFEFISADDKNAVFNDLDIKNRITDLFSTNTHYKDRSHIMVYFVLDTYDVRTQEDYDLINEAIAWVRSKIMKEGQKTLLALFLREDFECLEYGKKVRNMINESVYGGKTRLSTDSVFMLSNRREDSAILSDWSKACRAFVDIIALSNSTNAENASLIFSNSVKTVGYGISEKPMDEIANVVVSYMLQELNVYRGEKEQGMLLEKDEFDRKIGLTNEGTIGLLDEYGLKHLVPTLPDDNELKLFPRRDMRSCNVSELSEREFNFLTMNAWDAYIGHIINRAESSITTGMGIKEELKQKYRIMLEKNFTVDELVYLSDNKSVVRSHFKNVRMPNDKARVIDAAKNRLLYKLSTNDTLIDFFMQGIEETGQHANEFVQTWIALMNSLNRTFRVDDESICEHYERIARVYFDRNKHELSKKFKRINDFDELEMFLKDLIDNIIVSDPVFFEPFEIELEKRLKYSSDPRDARSYIRNELTGDEVKIFLKCNFAIGNPIFSSILLNQKTSLYSSLRENLDRNVYYFNTGCSDSAEALIIYNVEQDNLVS